MATTRELEIILALKDEVSKGFSKLNKQVEGTKKGIVSANQKATTFSTTLKKLGAVVGISLLARKMFELGKTTINTAAKFEQFEVAFTTMLGSADRAKDLLDDIKDFAAKTPFDLPQVVTGAKGLLAFGVEAKKILPTMKALGDVSAGLSVPMTRLILNFGQVKTQGKLTGRELRDFAVAGVPLVAELAKNLGVLDTEIAGMVSAGKIGFEDVEKAFQTMTTSTGRFADLMIKQSATVSGIFSNIGDNFTQVLLEIGNAILPLVKIIALKLLGALDNFRQWVNANKESIQAFFFNLFGTLKLIGSIGKNVFVILIKALNGVFIIVKKLMAIKFLKWLTVLIAVWANWNKVLKVWNIILAFNPLVLIVSTIAVLIGYLIDAWKRTGSLSNAFKDLWERLKQVGVALLSVGKLMFFALTGQFGKIKEEFAALKESFADVFAVPGGAGRPETTGSGGGKVAEGGVFTDALTDAILNQEDALVSVGQTIADNVTKGFLMNLFEPIQIALVGFEKVLIKGFTKTFGKLLQPITTFVTMAINLFSNFFDSVIFGLSATIFAAVSNFALLAASAAASAVAGIPFIGPGLAVAAYGTTLALVMGGIGKIIGLAEGTSEVIGGASSDTVPAMLTPGEIVIPKSMAQGIRSGDVTLEGKTGQGKGATNIFNFDFNGANFNGTIGEMLEALEMAMREKFEIIGSQFVMGGVNQ